LTVADFRRLRELGLIPRKSSTRMMRIERINADSEFRGPGYEVGVPGVWNK